YGASINLSDEGQIPEQFPGTYSSANIFAVIGQQPVVGRNFSPDDDQVGAAPVLLISNGVWKRRYGSDPSVVGRPVKINNLVATIIGVMPEGMQFPFNTELWIPLSQLPPGVRDQKRDIRNFTVMGRLADGVTPAQARAEVERVAEQLAKDFPAT